jgi:uncharacterized RDD family membrane protein YckC
MYCPHCGAKNSSEGGTCFVCEKKIPRLDDSGSSRARSSSAASSAPKNPGTSSVAASGEPVAALGDRLIAIILDMSLIAVFFATAWVALSRWPKTAAMLPAGQALTLTVAGSFVVFTFLYFFLLEGAFGATLGKAVAGVHVRLADGSSRIGFRASLWRNLLRLIDGVGFYFLGYLVALFSRQRRRIGDLAAGTVVVQRNMAWGERVTVVLIWMVGVAALSWGAYTLCPTCVDLPISKVVQALGFNSTSTAGPVGRLASN